MRPGRAQTDRRMSCTLSAVILPAPEVGVAPSLRFDAIIPSQRRVVLAALQRLHEEVDAACASLEKRHAPRLTCSRGCHACCIDRITVFSLEAELIRLGHEGLLLCGSPHPRGACAFLDERGACRIYPRRPYVCRTQGLPLRWIKEDGSGSVVEYRDICPLNDVLDAPLQGLDAEDCWSIGPFEQRLAALQRDYAGGEWVRVELRSLFRHADGY